MVFNVSIFFRSFWINNDSKKLFSFAKVLEWTHLTKKNGKN